MTTRGPVRAPKSARISAPAPKSAAPAPRAAIRPGWTAPVREVVRSPGQPLDGATRAFMEARLPAAADENPAGARAEQQARHFADRAAGEPAQGGRLAADFSGIRIHADAQAAESARDLGARAYTIGEHLVFGPGQFAPHTPAGRRLLAHELAHAQQQAGRQQAVLQRDPLQDELNKELAAWAAADKTRVLDPNHADYALTLQGYAWSLTHDPVSMDLLAKPSKPAEVPAWEKKFKKADRLAEMIGKGGPKVTDKDSRAGLIAIDLADSGFITQAMERAAPLDPSQRVFVYQSALKSPSALTEAHVKTIAQFYIGQKESLGTHPLMMKLRDRSGDYAKALGNARLKAAMDLMVDAYEADADFVEGVSELLVFRPEFRADFSALMWSKKKGDLLFKLLDSEYFREPGTGGTQFADAAGKPRELTMAGDMPWVYTNKQKYYTEYLVGLGAKAGVAIPQPKSLAAGDLKAWLDANTELIGQALKALYPKDPGKIAEVYTHMADIFFYHVDPDVEDVPADPAGKLAKLPAGAPQQMRMKADCDVLATYAARLMTSSGYTPLSYLGIKPSGKDKARAAHATVLMQHDKTFYAVSNHEVRALGAADKAAALKETREFALEIYKDPDQLEHEVYAADAGAKGEMPADFPKLGAAYRRADLETAAAAP